MDKKFFFLGGLFRSGNTLLSSILNQNNNIFVSPLSPVCHYICTLNTQMNTYLMSIISEDKSGSENVIKNLMNNYYSGIDKKYIVDREKFWGTPDNLNIIKKYITTDPKIIFTTRPVLETIASTIRVNKDNMYKYLLDTNFKFNKSLTINDNICEFLLANDGEVRYALETLKSIDDPKNQGIFHIVKYEDLTNSPDKVMNGIYDFLEIDSYKHNFTRIVRKEEYLHKSVGLPKDLHKIKRVLTKNPVILENYFSISIIEKYKDIRYF